MARFGKHKSRMLETFGNLLHRYGTPVCAAIALTAVFGWGLSQGAASVHCRSEQLSLLRQQAYENFPGRAAYAAHRYCERHGNKVAQPRR